MIFVVGFDPIWKLLQNCQDTLTRLDTHVVTLGRFDEGLADITGPLEIFVWIAGHYAAMALANARKRTASCAFLSGLVIGEVRQGARTARRNLLFNAPIVFVIGINIDGLLFSIGRSFPQANGKTIGTK